MEERTHWLFPVLTSQPDALIAACRGAGFDAARGASSVGAVAAPVGRPEADPKQAPLIMSALVFLPAYPELPQGSLERLADAAAAKAPLLRVGGRSRGRPRVG
jgi:hypothetical protein